MDEEASPADSSRTVRLRQFLAAGMLRAIDATGAFLQRARSRIEAPDDEETARDDRKSPAARDREVATPQVVGTAAPGRLRRFLVVMLALLIGGISGMAYSYRLLSRSIDSRVAVADYLRDEITQLEKEGARNVNEMARYQKKIRDNDKEIAAYQQGMRDYEKQLDELRSELNTLKGVRTNPPAQDSHGAAAAKNRRPTPEKTGTCTMGSANAAANLAHCVQEFNRK